MRAVERRAPVIYQAAMFDGRFVGFADFLLLEDGDALPAARHQARPLGQGRGAAAAGRLRRHPGRARACRWPPRSSWCSATAPSPSYRVDELLPVYRPRRAALQRLLDDHLAGGTPVAGRTRTCAPASAAPNARSRSAPRRPAAGRRHAGQPARPADRRGHHHRARAGRATTARCPNCRPAPSTTLTAQARLQVADRVDGKPPYEVVDAQPLMVLPDADKGDLFFDFEGDPLWTVDGREWGLEYLWGVLTVADEFRPFWAHDRASERQALRRLPGDGAQAAQALPGHAHLPLRGLREERAAAAGRPLRRRRERGRRTAAQRRARRPLSRWCARAFASAPRTTASSRSSRCTWATSCAAARSPPPPTRSPSTPATARCATTGRTDEAAIVLKEIEDYNRYDCRSTRRLRDWLIARAIESGVPPRGPQPVARRRQPSRPPTTSTARC